MKNVFCHPYLNCTAVQFWQLTSDRFQVICNSAVVEYPSDGITIQSLYQVASSILKN
ncbi:MAG: hypothetical protein RMY29_026185 [Nostoc sp. CreGUA01]|nr:hypothetical protein [Nostoc sp. CreGUA01]